MTSEDSVLKGTVQQDQHWLPSSEDLDLILAAGAYVGVMKAKDELGNEADASPATGRERDAYNGEAPT